MDEEPQKLEWLEPPSPEVLLPDAAIWPWLLAAAIVLALAIGAWILLARKKSAAVDPAALRKAAFAEALASLEGVSADDPREAAVQASLILRKYLSVAAADPALFETHEEFIARHDSLQALKDETRTAAAAGFSRLAALKYSPEIPGTAATEILADARSLLETLHQGFAA